MVTLNEHTFLDSQETVYSTTLQNGLTVYLIQKMSLRKPLLYSAFNMVRWIPNSLVITI